MAQILIVEDDPVARAILTDLLSEAGHRVHEAEDWISTVEALRQAAAISVMILDVNLPGLSGDRIAKLLSTNPERPKILLHSGLEHEELERLSGEIGAAGYLSKGLPDALILGAVTRAHAEFVREQTSSGQSAPPFPPPSVPPGRSGMSSPLFPSPSTPPPGKEPSAPLFPPASSPPPVPRASSSSSKVLVFDEDEVAREEARSLLEAAGFGVVCVDEWVGLSERIFSDTFALVLIDVSPGGGDAATVSMLRESKPDCPPILLWGTQPAEALRALATEHGASGVVEKMRAGSRLVFQVRRLLR